MRKKRKLKFIYRYDDCVDRWVLVLENKRGEIVGYVACDPKTGKKELIRIEHD